VTAEATPENALKKLSARWMPDSDGGFKRLVVEKTPAGFRARTETDALTPGSRLASGIVRTSLFAATGKAPARQPMVLHCKHDAGATVAAIPAIAAQPGRRSADPRLASLTRRERQVLALLPRGLTNAALAEELGIAPGTAKVHVERILHKLALADRTQAAVFAMRQGVAT